MPEGSTFEETVIVAEELSSRVLAMPDVETVGVSVGGGGMMQMLAAGMGFGGLGGGGTTINMNLVLSGGRDVTEDEFSARIREICDELGLETSVDAGGNAMDMMAGEAVSLRVEGMEFDDIRDTAIALAELVSSVDGTMNVTDITREAASELRVRVDKDASMSGGLTVAQVFMAVSSRLNAPERSMNMTLSGKNYEVIVSDGDFTPLGRAELESMHINTSTGSVSLSDIAEVYEDTGFSTISRINRNRFVNISAEIAEGYNVGLVNAEIERLLEGFTPVGDTRVVIGGQAEAITEAFNDLILMLILGLLFTYLIMVAQFQSLLSPFIIMFTVPLAFTGGFAALIVAGMPLSVVAMIGLILLAGVSINNGILIVSRITQMRWEGMSKIDAIIDSARKRIRPILMTAISTICAMSVLALGIGEGTEMMQPMAVATIGGLLYATAMTLFVVPILYDLLHRNKDITKEDLDSPEVA
jgi:HAE1 family hydrophobic/amphiphilic exporter-1